MKKDFYFARTHKTQVSVETRGSSVILTSKGAEETLSGSEAEQVAFALLEAAKETKS